VLHKIADIYFGYGHLGSIMVLDKAMQPEAAKLNFEDVISVKVVSTKLYSIG